MTNLQHFLLAYRHIKALSLPDDPILLRHVLILKASADVVFSKLLSSGCIEFLLLSADKPASSVPSERKREGRRK